MPTYGPMLTKEMSDELESIQKRACKLIFGWDSSYKELLEENKIESLEERRKKLKLKLCSKNTKESQVQGLVP